MKLAQPRYQRDNQFQEDGVPEQGNSYQQQGAQQNRFAGQQGNFNAGVTSTGTAGTGQTPFDPQALAALYTRMMQMAGGGMNPTMMGGMGGGMNPMMGAMAGGPGFGGGMRPGMGMGMPMGMGAGMPGVGGMGGPAMGGMGRGMMQAGMAGNIPRGPRGGPAGPSGNMPGNASVGPQRTGQRGQHNFHPYAR